MEDCEMVPVCPLKDELRDMIRETVRTTLLETLNGFGVDTAHPIEMQADLRSLREWRISLRSARRGTTFAILSVLLSGALAALWMGLRQMFR